MSQRIMKWVGAAAAALVLGMAAPAQAIPLYIESSVQSPPGAYEVTISGLPGANGAYPGGAFTMTASWGTSYNASASFNFTAWCVDVFHTLSLPKQYDATAFTTPPVNNSATPATLLTQTQVDQVIGLALAGNGALAGANTGLFASYTDRQVSAAVQAAIWKAINPGATISVTGNAGANTLFGSIMTNISTFQAAGAGYAGTDAAWVRSIGSQGQVITQGQIAFLTPPGGGGFEVIPAPAGLLILGFGLLGLAAVRRAA